MSECGSMRVEKTPTKCGRVILSRFGSVPIRAVRARALRWRQRSTRAGSTYLGDVCGAGLGCSPMKKYEMSWARFAVLAALLPGAACWGDVEIVGDPSVGGAAITPQMTDTSPLEPAPCEIDEVRCEGADLKRCVAL